MKIVWIVRATNTAENNVLSTEESMEIWNTLPQTSAYTTLLIPDFLSSWNHSIHID